MYVEPVVRDGERKSWISCGLVEIDVLSKRKILQFRKFIEAERRPEIDSLIRIRAPIISICIPGPVEIETQLQGVLADHVIDAVRQRILSFKNSSDRERSIAQNESRGTIENHGRRVRSQTGWGRDFVILRSAGVKFVQQVGGEGMGPPQRGLKGTDVGVGQGLRPIVADRRVKDHATRRVETVQV